MRQFYSVRVKAITEVDMYLRADNKKEALVRAKENTRSALKDIDFKTKSIKVINIEGDNI